MQVPTDREDHAQHGRRRGEDRREGARRGDGGADDHRRAARPDAPRAASRSRSSRSARGCRSAARVTLRGDRMWEFLDRLVSIALPRIRDFRGLNPNSFDGRGNYSLGLREQIIFPEIDYDTSRRSAASTSRSRPPPRRTSRPRRFCAASACRSRPRQRRTSKWRRNH